MLSKNQSSKLKRNSFVISCYSNQCAAVRKGTKTDEIESKQIIQKNRFSKIYNEYFKTFLTWSISDIVQNGEEQRTWTTGVSLISSRMYTFTGCYVKLRNAVKSYATRDSRNILPSQLIPVSRKKFPLRRAIKRKLLKEDKGRERRMILNTILKSRGRVFFKQQTTGYTTIPRNGNGSLWGQPRRGWVEQQSCRSTNTRHNNRTWSVP